MIFYLSRGTLINFFFDKCVDEEEKQFFARMWRVSES